MKPARPDRFIGTDLEEFSFPDTPAEGNSPGVRKEESPAEKDEEKEPGNSQEPSAV